MQDLSESVVVEPYQASSECVEFSVTVLGSSKGPVVLLPTEVESYDMEDDLCEAALDFEVYKARREVALVILLLLVRLLRLLLLLLLHMCRLLYVLPMWQLFLFIFVVSFLLCQCGSFSSSLSSPPCFANVAAALLHLCCLLLVLLMWQLFFFPSYPLVLLLLCILPLLPVSHPSALLPVCLLPVSCDAGVVSSHLLVRWCPF